eukprot:m.381654 g.381654  ORF g.381654 m.381654 type:complete len:53 (+) comp112125_c0_seq1:94-252(+)
MSCLVEVKRMDGGGSGLAVFILLFYVLFGLLVTFFLIALAMELNSCLRLASG